MIIDDMIHGSFVPRRAHRSASPVKLRAAAKVVCGQLPGHRMGRETFVGQRVGTEPVCSPGISDQHSQRRIDAETPVVPRAIAEGALEEVSAWQGHSLPPEWVGQLVERANTIYTCNTRFRGKIRGQGNAGRDCLWMFMRHWLAALIQRHEERLFARLPQSYCVGVALPGSSRKRERRVRG